MAEKITKLELLYAFIDTYLPLTPDEMREFQRHLSKLPPEEQKAIEEIITTCETSRPRWSKYLSEDP